MEVCPNRDNTLKSPSNKCISSQDKFTNNPDNSTHTSNRVRTSNQAHTRSQARTNSQDNRPTNNRPTRSRRSLLAATADMVAVLSGA